MMKWFKKESDKQKNNEESESAFSGTENIEKEIMEEDVELELKEEVNEEESHDLEESPPEPVHINDKEKTYDTSPGFLKGLRNRLSKTRKTIVGSIDRLVLGKKEIDDDLLDELEEILITADLGVRTTQDLILSVTEKVKRRELSDPEKLKTHLKKEIKDYLSFSQSSIDFSSFKPFVVLFIGVNGVGKTTTIAKLAYRLKSESKKVLLVAADTFRAAAVEQLVQWGEKVQVEVVHQKSGADPSAVVFDALSAAEARGTDVVLIDTAGRMHTKVNLMEELKKIKRVINKKLPGAPHETLLVLDANTGQNAISQAQLFKDQLGITGLVLTKLDGTAKGGVVVGICRELKIPVRYIGVGEKIGDLPPFIPDNYVEAIF